MAKKAVSKPAKKASKKATSKPTKKTEEVDLDHCIVNIENILHEAKIDITKFQLGTVSAGRRVRKYCQEMKREIQTMRVAIQTKINNR
jgi:pyruvate/2-oxoglutarate dehydrogenase complex dihydrolipoamide acyltransferase (E2) component